jgi:dihydroorotase-like cyclic amidohydrolase
MANLALVDMGLAWVGEAQTQSKSLNNPYQGMDFKGRVVHTIYNGEFTLKNQLVRKSKFDV